MCPRTRKHHIRRSYTHHRIRPPFSCSTRTDIPPLHPQPVSLCPLPLMVSFLNIVSNTGVNWFVRLPYKTRAEERWTRTGTAGATDYRWLRNIRARKYIMCTATCRLWLKKNQSRKKKLKSKTGYYYKTMSPSIHRPLDAGFSHDDDVASSIPLTRILVRDSI
jgi:hypothetical protein